ncbi:LytTR family DNA-binding domain-containing protein [Lapidilactobacillus salsurivasis]
MGYFVSTSREQTLKIPLDDIIYVVTTKKPHRLKIVTEKNEYLVYDNLQWFEKQSINLVFSNRSCIINIAKVISIEKSTRIVNFVVPLHDVIRCSRGLYKSVITAWLAI